MTANPSPDAAVTDADLVRYLDGEFDDAGRARIEAALASDPALAVRLEELRRRALSLKTLRDASDAPPDGAGPAERPARPGELEIIDLNAAWAAHQGVEPHVVRPYRPMPGWVRAAAILALLLAASLLIPPVRAWIAGMLAPVLGGRDDASSSVEAPAPAPGAPIDTLSITFATTGATFAIEFTAAPASGTLVVERMPGARRAMAGRRCLRG